ncbi:MAG: hypothetical protein L0J68_10855 [Micrococcaceae bacterium]|nr:hypothetical protein [Micrococcaceae bacterium]
MEALAGELLAPGSAFAFLAGNRQELFPDSMMEDLFISKRGRPSIPGTGDRLGHGLAGPSRAL